MAGCDSRTRTRRDDVRYGEDAQVAEAVVSRAAHRRDQRALSHCSVCSLT